MQLMKLHFDLISTSSLISVLRCCCQFGVLDIFHRYFKGQRCCLSTITRIGFWSLLSPNHLQSLYGWGILLRASWFHVWFMKAVRGDTLSRGRDWSPKSVSDLYGYHSLTLMGIWPVGALKRSIQPGEPISPDQGKRNQLRSHTSYSRSAAARWTQKSERQASATRTYLPCFARIQS